MFALFNGKPNARAYNTYNKVGQVITRPPSLTAQVNNGCYFPSIVDMRSVTNFPYDYAVYFSTDHSSGAGGIWLYLSNDLVTWVSYDSAVTAGAFDYIATKPSVNPIYQDSVVGTQTETPQVRVIGADIIMTYHNSGVVPVSLFLETTKV